MTTSEDLEPVATTKAVISSGFRTWALALVAALAAGLIAWAAGEATYMPEDGLISKEKKITIQPSVVGTQNGVISFSALGAAMGLALGLSGGLIRRSAVPAGMAGATGLVLGGAVGFGLAQLLVPIYYAHVKSNDLTYSIMVHAGVWVALGGVAGAAFGIGLGGGWAATVRATIGGAGAVLLATVIYDFAGGILFPPAMTDRPVSVTWASRLVARLLVTVMAAVGIVLAAGSVGGATNSREAKA